MKKAKEIITKYGVAIVKPWSQEMYDHNDVVADKIKENMFDALTSAYITFDEYTGRKIAETLEGCRYGMGYGIDEMYEATNKNLDQVQNFWLNTEYPDLVEADICPAVEPWFIGYTDSGR